MSELYQDPLLKSLVLQWIRSKRFTLQEHLACKEYTLKNYTGSAIVPEYVVKRAKFLEKLKLRKNLKWNNFSIDTLIEQELSGNTL